MALTRRRFLGGLGAASAWRFSTMALPLAGALSACQSTPPAAPGRRPTLGLALGGGAARGFAHIGVLKVFEANGIIPDWIVGTSAGSLVGALYASGLSAFELQRLGLALDEATFSDWTLRSRGLLKGEALAAYVNQQLKNRTIEALPRRLAIVATDLRSGEPIVFQRGDTGTAVRASSAVPGIFSPVRIQDRDYVDGGLTHPVPAAVARALGAQTGLVLRHVLRHGRLAALGTSLLPARAARRAVPI